MAGTSLAPTGLRRVELDRLRGLAILLMVGDHVAAIWAYDGYRLTFGRLAMPLFFVVAGHLAGRRFGRRHLIALALGLALPLVVPWVDSPNVLVWFALGAGLLYLFDSRGWPTWVLILPGLIIAANGYGVFNPWAASSYEPFALLALMALGRGLSGSVFEVGKRLPAWVGTLGRYPLSWYVGHVLVLQVLRVAFGHG